VTTLRKREADCGQKEAVTRRPLGTEEADKTLLNLGSGRETGKWTC
jgi:hypothetical protein